MTTRLNGRVVVVDKHGTVKQPQHCDYESLIGQVMAVQPADDHSAPIRVIGRVIGVERTSSGIAITTQARDDDTFGYTVGDPP